MEFGDMDGFGVTACTIAIILMIPCYNSIPAALNLLTKVYNTVFQNSGLRANDDGKVLTFSFTG
jgi:hypothetical protein